MAVTQDKIKERLRALFPKANLSKARLDAIAAKLAVKPEDEATDDQVDEIINDYNEVFDFEQIAKDDDRIRTLETKRKPKPTPTKIADDDDDSDDDSDDKSLVKLIRELKSDITALKAERTQETVAQRFTKAAKEKGIPEAWVKRSIPASEDQIDEVLTELETDWKDFAEKNKLQSYGNDQPSGGTPPTKGKVKPISADDAKKIVESM